MTGWKDLQECGKVRHGETLKLSHKNGKFYLVGLNSCKKPCCQNCLPKLLKKQEKAIFQAVEYAEEHNLKMTLWTINLPKNQNQSIMFQRIKLHNVISDFLRTSTRDNKLKPLNKVLKEINKMTDAIGYVYRNEVNFNDNFNAHVHIADFRKIPLTEVQKEKLKSSLISICERNGVFISAKQSYSAKDVMLNFKDDFNVGYLTKIDDHDAVKLKETNPTKYQEYCNSQILLNRKSNSKVIKIPLIYWKKGLKKLIGIRETKAEHGDDNFISVPKIITDFMTFNKIKPSKLIEVINYTSIEILQNENIFNLLSV